MLMNTYNRYPVTFTRGEGCYLFDENGKKYLDFAAGIGVNSVGHAHPVWVKAVSEQAAALSHVSNLYHTKPAALLAEKLAALTGLESVFFANSGAEANEGMIKMARKYGHDVLGASCDTIVTLTRSFHGRTISTLAATGQDVFHKHFAPFTPGFRHVPPEDIGALEAMDGDVCAVMLEPVQGEGGVLPLSESYIKAVAALCAERGWLLLFDEVQTGVGRTGDWFAFQRLGIKPDGVSFAKGIAGGLPLGGFMANAKCSGLLGPGDHASTFGGNPVSCAAGLAVLDIVEDVLPSVATKGERLKTAINSFNGLNNARGAGLMLGATVDTDTHGSHRALVEKLLDAGLVCLTAGSDSLRLMPPLTITDDEINEGLAILRKVCENGK